MAADMEAGWLAAGRRHVEGRVEEAKKAMFLDIMSKNIELDVGVWQINNNFHANV
nr:hypothetical protein [Chromobacterium sp. ASV5]